jgi:hypothetical protein
MRTLASCSLVLLASTANAFFPQFQLSTVVAKSAFADEAIAVFGEKYPFGREPIKQPPFLEALLSAGVPARDIDGTEYKMNGDTKGKRFTDISEKQARATFAELSKLYGEEYALEMTKALPICLSFDKALFAGSLKEYIGIFGEEEAKAMVCRNPGLLAVRPAEAAKATDQTMKASYLIAVTRPYGKVLLPTLVFLLLVPTIEAVSGIAIRATIVSTIIGA